MFDICILLKGLLWRFTAFRINIGEMAFIQSKLSPHLCIVQPKCMHSRIMYNMKNSCEMLECLPSVQSNSFLMNLFDFFLTARVTERISTSIFLRIAKNSQGWLNF